MHLDRTIHREQRVLLGWSRSMRLHSQAGEDGQLHTNRQPANCSPWLGCLLLALETQQQQLLVARSGDGSSHLEDHPRRQKEHLHALSVSQWQPLGGFGSRVLGLRGGVHSCSVLSLAFGYRYLRHTVLALIIWDCLSLEQSG